MDTGNEELKKGFMRKAIDKAREGILKGQAPFGACVVRGNKVISCEHNKVWQEKDSTLHAEICAIRAAEKSLETIDLSGCTIYSTTEPCPMCFAAIHWAKIEEIVHGNLISEARGLGFSELTISNVQMNQIGQSPLRISGGFLKEECQSLFADWSSTTGKRVY